MYGEISSTKFITRKYDVNITLICIYHIIYTMFPKHVFIYQLVFVHPTNQLVISVSVMIPGKNGVHESVFCSNLETWRARRKTIPYRNGGFSGIVGKSCIYLESPLPFFLKDPKKVRVVGESSYMIYIHMYIILFKTVRCVLFFSHRHT